MTPAEKPENPRQQMLALWIPTVQIPQGDGSVLVKPGRPVGKLTPKQFGREVGLSADTIYRRVGHDCLPERFVEYVGERKILILADALEHFREYWRGKRGMGA